jgi:hypothetical protein
MHGYLPTFAAFLPMALAISGAVAFADEGYSHATIADCHVHLLDFLQNGDFEVEGRFVRGGTAKQPLRPGQRIAALLTMMDHADVSHALVMGMPYVKKWEANDATRGGYYLDSDSRVVLARETDFAIGEAVLDFRRMSKDERQRARVYPFICGFDATDLGAVDRITRTIKAYPGVFHGIGEVMSRHDDLTNLTEGERPGEDERVPRVEPVGNFIGQRESSQTQGRGIGHALGQFQRRHATLKCGFQLNENLQRLIRKQNLNEFRSTHTARSAFGLQDLFQTSFCLPQGLDQFNRMMPVGVLFGAAG